MSRELSRKIPSMKIEKSTNHERQICTVKIRWYQVNFYSNVSPFRLNVSGHFWIEKNKSGGGLIRYETFNEYTRFTSVLIPRVSPAQCRPIFDSASSKRITKVPTEALARGSRVNLPVEQAFNVKGKKKWRESSFQPSTHYKLSIHGVQTPRSIHWWTILACP